MCKYAVHQFEQIIFLLSIFANGGADLFQKTLLFDSMKGIDDFSTKWSQMSGQATLNAIPQVSPLRTQKAITFTANTITQGDIETNLIQTDPAYKYYSIRFNFISPGKDVTITPSTTPSNDNKAGYARWLSPRLDWKASPPKTTFVWYADNYDNYFCCAQTLGFPVEWNWFIIQYGWENQNSQMTHLNTTQYDFLNGQSLSPVGIGVYHKYKLVIDFLQEKITYYSPMGDVVHFYMQPGQVSTATYCTFGLWENILQATFRNVTVDSDVSSVTGTRFRLQFQNPGLDNEILLDEEVNFQVSPSIWVNYIREFTVVEYPLLQDYDIQVLLQDAGDSNLESAPYFGDFFISHLEVEASDGPFFHQATSIHDVFATENGPSYAGMVGPVEIDLVQYTITAGLSSSGYEDEMIGKNGKFPNNACGSIDNDQLRGNPNNNQLYGDGGDDELYGLDGDDFLSGGQGDDFLEGGQGADSLNGDEGLDTITYLNSLGPVMVSLLEGQGWGFEAEGDTITNVQRVIGSNFNDIIIGNLKENFLESGIGDDIVVPHGSGYLNSDYVSTGVGQDIVIVTCSNGEIYLQDFDVANDQIDIRALNKIRQFSDLVFQSVSTTETLGFFKNDHQVTVKIYYEGVLRNQLTNANFIFLPLNNGTHTDCSTMGIYQYLLNGECLYSCPCNYQISNKICIPICDVLCLQCSSVDFKCYQCKPGYILEPLLGICLKKKRKIRIPLIIIPWSQPEPTDIPSSGGSTQTENSILICDLSCLKCFGPEQNQCLSCQPGLVFYGGYCLNCKDPANLQLKVCKGCDLTACEQCDGEILSSNCKKCQPGFIIIEGLCVDNEIRAIIFPKNQDVSWVMSVFYMTIGIHFMIFIKILFNF